MKTGNFPKEVNYETRGVRKKMRNVELYFTGTTVIYALQPFAAACSKIARTSVKVGKTRLLRPLVLLRVQERIYQSKLSTDHSSGER